MEGLEGPFLGEPRQPQATLTLWSMLRVSPLSADVQKKIKEIGQNAKVVGDRVRKFVRSIIDSTRHVGERGLRGCPHPQHPSSSFQPIPISNARSLPTARALRNVWLWLARAGNMCNRELGTPQSSCFRYMDKAKDRCESAFPLFFHFCYVILSFKALCYMLSARESLSLCLGGLME